ncbi:hypothetical protein [Bartonella sp. CB178]|uniref:hypothetical protein n=1 Tax=Bartonella sp. CB178 TaxID=3112255 RepID=UPI00300DE231
MFRWSFILASLIAATLSGFFYGRLLERNRTLVQAVSAFQNREKINDKVLSLSPFRLCIALGGMPDECKTLLRGMDETPNH